MNGVQPLGGRVKLPAPQPPKYSDGEAPSELAQVARERSTATGFSEGATISSEQKANRREPQTSRIDRG